MEPSELDAAEVLSGFLKVNAVAKTFEVVSEVKLLLIDDLESHTLSDFVHGFWPWHLVNLDCLLTVEDGDFQLVRLYPFPILLPEHFPGNVNWGFMSVVISSPKLLKICFG